MHRRNLWRDSSGLSHRTSLYCSVVVGAVQTGPHWRSIGSGMRDEPGLGQHIQQDNMFQCDVHCLVIIQCPPLSEGDWFTAYPTTWCLHLHCLYHVNCVTIEGCMAIFFYRTWAYKILLPFRPGLVRLCPAGRHRESVLPVVWEDSMWEGRGFWRVKFGQSSYILCGKWGVKVWRN